MHELFSSRSFRPLALALVVAALAIGRAGEAHAQSDPGLATTTVTISVCGDGLVTGSEVCDFGAGNNNGGYSQTIGGRTCNPGCGSFGPYCGDAILQPLDAEQCDDGNNVSGDLCSATCQNESPPTTNPGGPPTAGGGGSGGAPTGNFSLASPTTVTFEGFAYPQSIVTLTRQGVFFHSIQADQTGAFSYSTSDIVPGINSFGFQATDKHALRSPLVTTTFFVTQAAQTTISNILLPPTIQFTQNASSSNVLAGSVTPGTTITLSLVPTGEKVGTTLSGAGAADGIWSVPLDSASLSRTKQYTATARASLSTGIGEVQSSGSVPITFSLSGSASKGLIGDLNGDGKVNLVDFSILIFRWGTNDAQADFNNDGTVGIADFSIQLFYWTG